MDRYFQKSKIVPPSNRSEGPPRPPGVAPDRGDGHRRKERPAPPNPIPQQLLRVLQEGLGGPERPCWAGWGQAGDSPIPRDDSEAPTAFRPSEHLGLSGGVNWLPGGR